MEKYFLLSLQQNELLKYTTTWINLKRADTDWVHLYEVTKQGELIYSRKNSELWQGTA